MRYNNYIYGFYYDLLGYYKGLPKGMLYNLIQLKRLERRCKL